MSRLDEILNNLLAHDVHIDWEKSTQPQAKANIKALFKELVGEDHKLYDNNNVALDMNAGPWNVKVGQNELKQELRTKIDQL